MSRMKVMIVVDTALLALFVVHSRQKPCITNRCDHGTVT